MPEDTCTREVVGGLSGPGTRTSSLAWLISYPSITAPIASATNFAQNELPRRKQRGIKRKLLSPQGAGN